MDNVTVMTTEKEIIDHVKVVMPLFHSTKAQLDPEALAYSTKAVGDKLDGDELAVTFCSNEV